MPSINAMFILLLPLLNALASVMVIRGVSIAVLFLPLPLAFTFAFIATELLKRFWNKDFLTGKALAVLIDLDREFILLKNVDTVMTGHTQCNEVIHAIIAADTSRDNMVNVKRSPVLFRRFTTILAYLITLTNSLRYFVPAISIIDIPPAIVPMVFTYQPFTHVHRINKEHISFTSLCSPSGNEHLFTTSARAIYFFAWRQLFLSSFCYRCFSVMLPIKVVMFSKFDSSLAFFGATCNQFGRVVVANFKRLAANHTYLSCMRVVMSTGRRAVLPTLERGCKRFLTMQTGEGVSTLSIVMSVFALCLECLNTFLRTASYLLFSTGRYILEWLTTDDANLLHTIIGTFAFFGAKLFDLTRGEFGSLAAVEAGNSNRHDIILSSQDSSSIFGRRLVTKPALSAGDQPTQASLIISFLGTACKAEGAGLL